MRRITFVVAVWSALRVGAAAAAMQPPAQPVASPASAAAPAAPVDPELSAPLTPLDQFTLGVQQQPTGEAPSKPAAVIYAFRVTGLAKIGLERRFRTLSALAKGKRTAASAVQIAARAREDVKTAESLMRSEGYYDGRADLTITPAADATGVVQVEIAATPGGRYRLGSVTVAGPATAPPGLARKALTLHSGQPIVAPAVEAAEAQVSLQLPQQGYPFVKLGQRDVVLDGAALTGDYTLPVDPGARSSFGRIQVAKKPVLSRRHLQVIPRFKPGQLYDSRLVDDLRRALVATSLYNSVGVSNVDTGAKAADGTEVVDLLVDGTPAPTRTLSGSVGYETGLGVSVSAAWTNRNLFPPEGALTLQRLLGTEQSLVGVTFRRSNFGQRDRSLQATAEVSREDLDAYRANTLRLATAISRDSTPIWQKRWTYSVGAEALVSEEIGYDLRLASDVRRTYEIGALPLQLGYDASNSLLDPTRGFRLVLRPSPEVSVGSGTQPYLKGLLEGTAYQGLGPAFVLAGRVQLGGLFGADASDIAPSRRFYAGGGGSVRGFGYQQLGPKDPSNNPIGGSSLTTFSIEGRYRRGDLGGVLFLDGGQVYETSTPRFSDIRYGVGVGARFYTNFGPLRFDVATPVQRRPGDSLINVYISIGQAF